MQVLETIKIRQEYHKANLKDNTIRAYQSILSNFNRAFGDKNIKEDKTSNSKSSTDEDD